jgi:diaminopimelate decarboxylase
MGEGVLTSGFARVDGALACEGVALERIAREVGTPTYVYSAAMMRDRYRGSTRARALPHRIHYTLKANSNRGILRCCASWAPAWTSCLAASSIARCASASRRGHRLRRRGEDGARAARGARGGRLLINVESEAELRAIDRIAARWDDGARRLRVNPEVTVDSSHRYIKTGERGAKFGIPFDEVLDVARVRARCRNVELAGLDMHIGSQLFASTRTSTAWSGSTAARRHSRRGIDTLRYLDIGGGLACRTPTRSAPTCTLRARAGEPREADRAHAAHGAGPVHRRQRRRCCSRGCSIASTAADGLPGLRRGDDGADRPSHYDAYHRIESVQPNGASMTADVVGPICESGDFLALGREMDDAGAGDLLAVHDVGAYGYVMASNYNTRPRGAEVLVDGDRFAVVTARERYEDLVHLEAADPDWRTA